MQAFADAAQAYAEANPRLKFLHGFIFMDRGQLLSTTNSSKKPFKPTHRHSRMATTGAFVTNGLIPTGA
jgi:hypothetical protein